MNELAKWAWIIILVVLFCGKYIIPIIIAEVVLVLLILWLKPEWFDKIK